MSSSSLLGTLLAGRFRILELMGEGSVGEVYLAEHDILNRKMVIKVLKRHLEHDKTVVERFRREARAASHLDHPNIVFVADFGQTEDGRFYLVMEYIPGESLEQQMDAIAPRLLSVSLTLEILHQVAGALHAAHDSGVVHRDLKPANILLGQTRSGRAQVKVLDFGLAKIMEDDLLPLLTMEGEVFGTPAYMSPEQSRGESVDARTDLYSFGATAYEMVTGDVPFPSDTLVELFVAHQEQEPADPSTLRSHLEDPIPSQLAQIILRCLNKGPAQRPGSAKELWDELGLLLERVRDAEQEVGIGGTSPFLKEIITSLGVGGGMGDTLRRQVSVTQPDAGPFPSIPDNVTPEWLWDRLCKKTHSLAEKLRIHRLGSADLDPVLTSLTDVAEQVLAFETDLALSNSRIDDLEGAKREQEARLRHAVVELGLRRSRFLDGGQPDARRVTDLDFQINELERQLAAVSSQMEQSQRNYEAALRKKQPEHVDLHRRQSELEQQLQHLVFAIRPSTSPPEIAFAYDELSNLSRVLSDKSR
jgi:serine/threonine protein kinase